MLSTDTFEKARRTAPRKPAEDLPHTDPESKLNPTAVAPQITSLKDLLFQCSHFTNDGRYNFLESSFAYLTEDHTAYIGRSSVKPLDVAAVNAKLTHVPDEDVYPIVPQNAIIASTDDGSVFIKRPSLQQLVDMEGSALPAKLLLNELKVLELLESRPHPNIVRYHGCRVCRGRVVGLALERHLYTLQECLLGVCKVDLDMVSGQEDIRSAVTHMHSFGIAHNDIRPCNIMISRELKWILIDMGASRPFGEQLIQSGNPDWTTSSKENDEAALRHLQALLGN